MNEHIHAPPSHAEPIYRWYKRAQIDYTEYYIRLYIAYNTWYREVTASTNDRQALAMLKKRVIIWEDYRNDRAMRALKVYMERLVDLTQKEPLAKTLHWSGVIHDSYDWRSRLTVSYKQIPAHKTTTNNSYCGFCF